MLPESIAPLLENLDKFREFAKERDVVVRRTYEWEWEDEETGEVFPSYWQVTIAKEEVRRDGLLHCYVMTVRDEDVAWEAQWSLLTELLGMGWRAYLEDAGVA